MWVSAFFGMATIYAEATLGQIYKTKVNGAITGGPAYYIQAIFKHSFLSRLLAYFFSISCILALGFMGNAVQANSIASAFEIAFHINPMIVGIVVAILAGLIFFGGTKRIASVTEKVVPLMAGMYIIICLLIIVDRKSTRLNSSHANISYAVFCLKKKKQHMTVSLNLATH